MTVKDALPSLPAASVAVQVTSVLADREQGDPEAGMQTGTSSPSTRSVAVGAVQVTMAPPGPLAATVTSMGHAADGRVDRRVDVR